jgi:uncharacterized protein (TIGR02001 family)
MAMWTALSNGDAMAIAPDGARRGVRLCEAAYIDVFDCAERELAAAPERPSDFTLIAAPSEELGPKPAPPPTDPVRVTYTLSLLSDYRRGGTSRTDGKPALQGGIDVRLPDRWNFGARGSNIAKHGNLEFALYGAKSFELGETELTFGATAIVFPRDPGAEYVFVQTSASRPIGPIDATVSIIYWPRQAHLDGEDGLYAVARARTPIGAVLGVPITLGASIGRMRGHFADARSRSDWSVSLTGRFEAVDIGITYVDNDLGDSRGHSAAVFSITHSF